MCLEHVPIKMLKITPKDTSCYPKRTAPDGLGLH